MRTLEGTMAAWRLLTLRAFIAGVAQSVEQLICNQQVGGSSPLASSTRV